MNSNGNTSKTPGNLDKTKIDDMEDDEFLEMTGMEEEEKRKSRQYGTILKPEIADEFDKMVKEDHYGSSSECLRELIRREITARKEVKSRAVLSKLLETEKISKMDIAGALL